MSYEETGTCLSNATHTDKHIHTLQAKIISRDQVCSMYGWLNKSENLIHHAIKIPTEEQRFWCIAHKTVALQLIQC